MANTLINAIHANGMTGDEFVARVQAIKASADVAYASWVANVRVGYLASAFQAIGSQAAAETVLARRADSQAAHERALVDSEANARTSEWRHVRAA